jgi:hypothetical protein
MTPPGAIDFGDDSVVFFEPKKTMGIMEVSNGCTCSSVRE